MAYYTTCPNCGANLDPGEKCDCYLENKEQVTKPENKRISNNNLESLTEFDDLERDD